MVLSFPALLAGIGEGTGSTYAISDCDFPDGLDSTVCSVELKEEGISILVDKVLGQHLSFEVVQVGAMDHWEAWKPRICAVPQNQASELFVCRESA